MGTKGLYFGGMPTDAEVKRLRDHFEVPTEGQQIAYADVSKIVNEPEKASRWRLITNRWRKQLYRDHNVLLAAMGDHFEVLTPSGRLTFTATEIRRGVRKVIRGRSKLLATDRGRLSAQEQKEYDHAAQVAATVEGAARLSSKRPAPQLPAAVG